jgi:hypothetical protein
VALENNILDHQHRNKYNMSLPDDSGMPTLCFSYSKNSRKMVLWSGDDGKRQEALISNSDFKMSEMKHLFTCLSYKTVLLL